MKHSFGQRSHRQWQSIRSNDNQNSSRVVHESGNQQFHFMQTSLDGAYFYENMRQMEYEAWWHCSYKVQRILPPTVAHANANHAAAWAGHTQVMGPWHHVPWCQLAADYSCALGLTTTAVLRLPPDRKNVVKRHTQLAQRCRNSFCFGCKQTLAISWDGQ